MKNMAKLPAVKAAGAVLISMLLLAPLGATAQKPIVYPAKKQTPQQQAKDDGECYVWAKQNTGIDPAAPPAPAAPPPPPPPQGGAARGALRGAAAGAVVGEAASGDASHGAAVGATAGAMRGVAAQKQKAAAQQQQAAAQQQQQQQQAMQTYYRAYGACMEGRGYTLK